MELKSFPTPLKSSPYTVALAPMEGVVDFVLRDLFSEIGGYDQFTTEFIRVTSTINPPKKFYRYCPELKTQGKTRHGVPVYVQLLGGDPSAMAENAAFACELGAKGIDLNFGCPAKRVNQHDGGASILKTPRRLYEIISAVRAVVPAATPVTAKVRLGFEDKNDAVEIAQQVAAARASKLTIHARTKVEGYRPPAHWNYIAKMKAVVQIPIVANGDIWNIESFDRCHAITNCQEFAIGRPALALPNLARLIKGLDSQPMPWMELQTIWLPKFIQAANLYNSNTLFALARTKQWLAMLTRTYPEAKVAFAEVKRISTYQELQRYF